MSPPLPPSEPAHGALQELLALSPEAFVEQLKALADDLRMAYAANTLRTWRADWRVWTTFCRAQGFEVLPVRLPALRAFLNERIDQGRRRATLEHYLATLATVHRLVGLPSPLDSIEARLMWRGLKRKRLRARQRQAQGLTLEHVERILATLDPAVPRDARDAALLTVAFETLARRSELVALQVQDLLPREADGSGRVLLPRSKTDPEGHGALLYLSPATLDRLLHWWQLAGIDKGAMFRSAHAYNRPGGYRNALSDRDVARIFKRLALRVGLEADAISGHSTRVGATQDLLAANLSTAEIMRQGRWTTPRMVLRYGERLEAGRSAMAQLTKKAT